LVPDLTNNVYAQIGLVTLVGLAGKNAILIVEYAKERLEAGTDLVEATLEAVRLRFRPIVMTSMSAVLGVVPLIIASGAGAISRQHIGWTVFGGLLMATAVGTFIVAVTYVMITKLAYSKKELEKFKEKAEEAKNKKEEQKQDEAEDQADLPAEPAPA
jgi:multidrug efflux pump subunit AcrB